MGSPGIILFLIFRKYLFKSFYNSLNNIFTLQKSFNRSGCYVDSSVPFLTFNQYIKTHMLTPSQYHNPLSENKQKLHKEIMKLHNKGLGYKRIHKKLIENGVRVAKSPNTIDFMIRKMLKRNKFLNQPIIDIYRKFEIQFLKVFKE